MQFHAFRPVSAPKIFYATPASSLLVTPVFTSISGFNALEIAAPPSPIPYILLFLVISIVAIVLVVRFPSLRKYYRKRNILAYFLLALALAVILFQAYEVPRRTVYNYYINNSGYSNSPNYYPGKINQFNLTCEYLESNPASFYMVVNSVNVSFPAQPQETYVPVNATAIKVLFTVSEGTSFMHKDTKPILFSINENVTGFSFTIYPETVSDTLFPAAGTYGMDYVWNGIENCYVSSQYCIVQP